MAKNKASNLDIAWIVEVADIRMMEYKEKMNYNSKDPLISVIVPVLDEAKIISRFLDAILHQDYQYFEVIIVDGQSSDGTAAIVKQYMGKDARIRLAFEEPRTGVGNARNIGLRKAQGQIIMFEDADWIESDPKFLSSFSKAFQDPEVMLVATKRLMEFKGLTRFEELFALFNLTMRTYPEWGFPGHYMAYRKEFIQKVGYFDPKMAWGDDKYFLKRALDLKPKISFGNPFYSASDIHFWEDFPNRYRWYGRTFFRYERKNVSRLTFVYLMASLLCTLTPILLVLGIIFPPIFIYGLLVFLLIFAGVYLVSFKRMNSANVPKRTCALAFFLPFLVLLQGWSFTYGLLEFSLRRKKKS